MSDCWCLLKAVGGAAWLNSQLGDLREDASAAAAADSLSNFKLEDRSDHRLHTLTLESMLRHMEEIQVSASLREGRRQIEKGTTHRLLFLVGRSPAVFTDAASIFYSFVLFFWPLSSFSDALHTGQVVNSELRRVSLFFVCLNRGIRRKWGEGMLPYATQTLSTGREKQQQQVKTTSSECALG